MQIKNIILASQSPRRKELLNLLDLNFKVEVPEVDEVYPVNLEVIKVAEYLANLKANAFTNIPTDTVVITADTVVILDEKILGKTKNKTEALKMLQSLSNRSHKVMTGVCIKSKHKTVSFSNTTKVFFKELTSSEINYYIENYNGEVAFATHNCGGCSQCDYQSSYRSGSPYLHIPDIKDIKYESNLGENNDWAITYHGSDRSVDIRELVGRLTPLGLQMIVKPRDLELSHEFDEWVAVEEFSNWIKESKRSYFHTLVIFPKNPTPEQITDFLRVKGRQENSLVAVFPSDTRSNNPVYPLSREFSKNQIIDHVLKEI